MNRLRGALFLILIGAVVALAVAAKLPARNDEMGAEIGFPFVTLSTPVGEPLDSPGQPTQPAPSTPLGNATRSVPASTYAAAQLAENPSPVPPVIEASGLLEQPPGANSAGRPTEPAENGWSSPPLQVPLARHPYDHYWFIRPVSSEHTNSGLPLYPYGSTGSNKDLRIHHGIDIANPVGVEVHAAGSGIVIWAGRGHHNQYESITAYGNTVVIEHDIGYQGKTIYTLYAHLSAILVEPGQRVETGQVIGLIGATGQVSGPHVHFEVRVDRNSYFAVRNPELWIAPYAGTGLIAGRVTFADGDTVDDTEVRVIDLASGRTIRRINTYAGFGVNADDRWNENFVVPSVPVGHYLVSASYGAIRWSGEVYVQEGMTNWVEMQASTVNAASGQ